MNVQINAPWPSNKMSPNARLHWASVAAAKKKARAMGCAKATMQPADFPNKFIPVYIKFYAPTKRKYDLDGLLSRCKAVLDGIAQGWGIDDQRFGPITIERAGFVKDGRVEFTFMGAKDE